MVNIPGALCSRKVAGLYWSGGDVVHDNGFGCYAQRGRRVPIGAENYHFSHSMPGDYIHILTFYPLMKERKKEKFYSAVHSIGQGNRDRNSHHQPFNVPTAGAQAFLMDYPQGERAITHHAGPVRIGGC
jgi:hypothetical protein